MHRMDYFFDLISIAYGVFAIRLGYEVWQKRASLFDADLTPDDARLAGSIAFYFLWPPAVLLHEFGHMGTASAFGGTNIQLHFLLYWGYVTFGSISSLRENWWISLAGNAVTLALGLCPLPYIRVLRGSPAWRLILFNFCKFQLFQVLIWYPGLCLFGFDGDFRVIYGPVFWWLGTTLTAVLHGLLLAAYLWADYTPPGKRWVVESILGWQPRPAVTAE